MSATLECVVVELRTSLAAGKSGGGAVLDADQWAQLISELPNAPAQVHIVMVLLPEGAFPIFPAAEPTEPPDPVVVAVVLPDGTVVRQ